MCAFVQITLNTLAFFKNYNDCYKIIGAEKVNKMS